MANYCSGSSYDIRAPKKGVIIQTSSKGTPKLQAISQKLNLEKGVDFVVLPCSNSPATGGGAA